MIRKLSSLVVRGLGALAMSCLASACSEGTGPVAPLPPTVDAVPALTATPQLPLTGTKPADTAIDLNGNELVPRDAATTWSAATSLQEGENRLVLTARNAAGQSSTPVEVQTVLDTIPPAAPSYDAPTSPTANASLTLTGGKEADSAILVNDVEVVPSDSSNVWSAGISLNEGDNLLALTAEDLAGNRSSPAVELHVILDTTAPSAPTIDVYLPLTDLTTQTIAGSKEAGASVWLDGGEVVPADSATTWSYDLTLTEGSHSLFWQSADVVGNLSAQTVITVDVDLTPPSTPGVDSPVGFTSTTAYTITGTKEAGTSILIDGVEAVAADGATTWQAQVTVASGQTTFTISSADAAGNVSSTTSVSVTLDTTPPNPPTVDAQPAQSTAAVLTFSGTKDADASVLANDSLVVPNDALTTWSADITLDEGTNVLAFSSTDLAGNLSSPDATVSIFVDSIPPVAPTVTSYDALTNQATQTISGSKEAGASVLMGASEVVAADNQSTWSYGLTLAPGIHALSFTSQDALGNVSTATDITIEYDNTPPALPTVDAVTSPTNTSPVLLSGTKDAGSGITIGGVVVVAADPSTSWSASVDLTEGTNDLVVASIDVAGNASADVPVSVVLDTSAPAAPAVDPYPTSTHDTSLTLTGSKDAGASIFVDGVEAVAADANTTWTVTLTLVDGANSFVLTSADAAGNVSSPVDLFVTVDVVPPSVLSVSPADGSSGATYGEVVTATFDEALDPATVIGTNVTVLRGTKVVPATVSYTNDVITINVGGWVINNTYTVTLMAAIADAAGNPMGTDYTWSFTVPASWSTPTVIATDFYPNFYSHLTVSDSGYAALIGLANSAIAYQGYTPGVGWGAVEVISPAGTEPTTGYTWGAVSNPDVSVTEDGTVWATWEQVLGTGSKRVVVASRDPVNGWAAPVLMNPGVNPENAWAPHVSTSNFGHALVSWLENLPVNTIMRVTLRTSYNVGGAWSGSHIAAWSSTKDVRFADAVLYDSTDAATTQGWAMWVWSDGSGEWTTFNGSSWNAATSVFSARATAYTRGSFMGRGKNVLGSIWDQEPYSGTQTYLSLGYGQQLGGSTRSTASGSGTSVSDTGYDLGTTGVGATATAQRYVIPGYTGNWEVVAACYIRGGSLTMQKLTSVTAGRPAVAAAADGMVYFAYANLATPSQLDVQHVNCGASQNTWSGVATSFAPDGNSISEVSGGGDAMGRVHLVWVQGTNLYTTTLE